MSPEGNPFNATSEARRSETLRHQQTEMTTDIEVIKQSLISKVVNGAGNAVLTATNWYERGYSPSASIHLGYDWMWKIKPEDVHALLEPHLRQAEINHPGWSFALDLEIYYNDGFQANAFVNVKTF